NHHAFPSSAAHALTWWQPDLSMGFLRLLQGLGLIWDVKLPSRRMVEEARVKPLEARQWLESVPAGCGGTFSTCRPTGKPADQHVGNVLPQPDGTNTNDFEKDNRDDE